MKHAARAIYGWLPLKRQVFSFMRSTLGIVPSFYEHLHFNGPFRLAIDDKHSILLNSGGNLVENELFWRGFGKSWEATSLQLWRVICKDDEGVILDIGANTGIYALVASALAPSSQVIAFEPIQRIAQDLKKNIDLNHLQVRLETQAVSDHDGLAIIYDLPEQFNYSASLEGQGPSATGVEIRVCSVDQFMSTGIQGEVRAIKLDVERHEVAAIAGMANTLIQHRPTIIIEILNSEIGDEVARRVAKVGYRMFHIVEGIGIMPTDRLEPLDEHNWNHLLCTTEQFDRLDLHQFLIP